MLEQVIQKIQPPTEPGSDQTHLEVLHPSHMLEFTFLYWSHCGSHFHDEALREWCVTETIWMVYVTQPKWSLLCKPVRFWQMGMEIYSTYATQDKPCKLSSLAFQNCHLSIWLDFLFFLVCPCLVYVDQFQIYWEFLRFLNQLCCPLCLSVSKFPLYQSPSHNRLGIYCASVGQHLNYICNNPISK